MTQLPTISLTSLVVWIRSNWKLVISGLYLMIHVKCINRSVSQEQNWVSSRSTGGLRISDEQQLLLSAVEYAHGWQRCWWRRKTAVSFHSEGQSLQLWPASHSQGSTQQSSSSINHWDLCFHCCWHSTFYDLYFCLKVGRERAQS